MNKAFRRLRFFFTACHSFGFGIHSPFVYDFLTSAVYEKNQYYAYRRVEQFRTSNRLKRDVSPKVGQLLFRTANYLKSENILEIGARQGVSTAYLALSSSRSACRVVTNSGMPLKTAAALKLSNVFFFSGDPEKQFSIKSASPKQIDLLFVNAVVPSSQIYFEQNLNKMAPKSVVILEAIHISAEREKEWKKMQSHPKVTASIDLFSLGLLFLDENLNKKNYRALF
jgi:predicted O-methyltransferase YrrM